MGRTRRQTSAIAIAVSAAVALYFATAFLFFPAYLKASLVAKHPAPEITSTRISAAQVAVGEPIDISVLATNVGDEADLQTVSVSFPNITTASKISIVSQDFLQKPVLISRGNIVGANYTAGAQSVVAQYAAIEAQSWPWEQGKSYRLDLRVSPETEGAFVVLVKSVALPHNSEMAHFPRSGVLDQQLEFAQQFTVTVKNH